MHLGIVLGGIENRGHWLWPSRSYGFICFYTDLGRPRGVMYIPKCFCIIVAGTICPPQWMISHLQTTHDYKYGYDIMLSVMNSQYIFGEFLARWLTSARAYRIGGRKLCPSVCLYVKRYLLLQFCTDYNQTWINMIWAVAAKTLLSQIFHNWRRIEVNCVYISHCKWYRTSAGMPACIPNRRCCAGQCAGQ